MKAACIVIPCYRMPLTGFEIASLTRCIAMLGKYPIFVIKPESLRLIPPLNDPAIRTESFPDECFNNIAGYNRLMLSDALYARFRDYEYMLVHQLDAFVFSDQLLDWCSRGYDYVGAPWLPKAPPTGLHKIYTSLRRATFRLIDKKNHDRTGIHPAQYNYCVGNGGFSLRRVSKMRDTLKSLPQRVQRYRELTHYTCGEDIFFCVEANRYRTNVRTPELLESLKFAWESNPALAASLCNGDLPFGCHGWDKLHRAEWRPIFANLGFSIDSLLEKPWISSEICAI